MEDNITHPVVQFHTMACPVKPVASVPHLLVWSLAHGSPAAPPPSKPTFVAGVGQVYKQNWTLN